MTPSFLSAWPFRVRSVTHVTFHRARLLIVVWVLDLELLAGEPAKAGLDVSDDLAGVLPIVVGVTGIECRRQGRFGLAAGCRMKMSVAVEAIVMNVEMTSQGKG